MKTKTIKQSVFFKAKPHELYEALMDSKKHAQFTGSRASISRRVGGKFSVYDGSIYGTNIELDEDKKIVQSWYCETGGWPDGHYSKAVFSLKAAKGGTKLTFTQYEVPEAAYEDILQGWADFYWEPMKAMLEKKKP